MSRAASLWFLTCLIFCPLVSAKGIADLFSLLSVDDEVKFGMKIEDFRKVNKNASEIYTSGQQEESKENRVFGEEVGKGEIGLITEETVYYYFVQDRLVRITWKDRTGNLDLNDTKKIKNLLVSSFRLSKRIKKPFLGDGVGVFDATQELYQSADGLELLFVASKPFFSIVVTDVGFLDGISKEGVFDRIADDAINEWHEKNDNHEKAAIEDRLDYLAVIFEEEVLEKAIRILKKNDTLPKDVDPVVETEAEFINVYWPVPASESGVPIPGVSKYAEVVFDKNTLDVLYVLGPM